MTQNEVTKNEAKEILRAQGLCGHVEDGYICIQLRHHDDDAHERGWTVARREVRSAYDRDDRSGVRVVFDVQESQPAHGRPSKRFTSDDESHAEWLAITLTRLDL
jgi:hypothetical protein